MNIRLAAAALLFVTATGPLAAGVVWVPAPRVIASFARTQSGEGIVVPGYSSTTSPGEPALPSKDIRIILPPDADLDSISVSLVRAKTVLLGAKRDIAPSPPMAVSTGTGVAYDWAGPKQINRGRNVATYRRNSFYPASHVELIHVGSMRKWRMATVRYYPYCYNPVSRRLRLASGGDIALSFAAGRVSAYGPDASTDEVSLDELAALAANYAEAQDWYGGAYQRSSQTVQASAGYAIITTSAIVQSSSRLQAFVNHKANRGFSVSVVTESQWGGGAGDAAANNIRAWLRANYLSRAIKYVLLIGNPNPATGSVPMKMLWPRYDSSTYREAPSDYFYADLTGNWDRNGNGYYGEQGDFGTGGTDLYPEVVVGRIPFYGSFADLDSILQKTIDYESGGIGGSWVRTALVTMKPSDANTPGYHLGEAIRNDAATPAGFTTTRVYEQNYGLSPAPNYTPCTYDTVLTAIRQHAGFWFWWTHGNETIADQVFSTDRTVNLDDRYPCFTFQCSCLNATPERSDNLGYALLKRGAIATDSATRVSWYYQGQSHYTNTDSNAGMAYRYAVNLVRDHMACGDAHYAMLIETPQQIWMNHLVFNIYGDPSVAYAAGPLISHAPLQDTDDNLRSYPVTADVASNGQLAAGNPVVNWNTNGGSSYSKAAMTLVSGITYSGQIPPQPLGATVYYYISAQDSQGRTGSSPTGAPGSVYSFKIRADMQPPTISHTPLTDTGITSGPYDLQATVTDDCGVSSVVLRYSINGAAEIETPMLPRGASVYDAVIPGPTQQGDHINYYILATDTSLARKTTRSPAIGYHTFSIRTSRVAVYNSAAVPPYFIGSSSNIYSSVIDALATDPKQRFSATAVTGLAPADLADKDSLVLPDNGVAIADLGSVRDWFKAGKIMVVIDSSAGYAAYSGFLWPAAAGTAGFGLYWDQNASVDDQRIAIQDPITAGYTLGQIIKSRGYGAQYFTDRLPPDARVLAVSNNVANRAYAVYRDVPGAGRFVALGPYRPLETAQYSILREALAVPAPVSPISVAAAKAMADGRLVKLSGVVVVSALPGAAYVEETTRIAGIRVNCAQPLTLGDVVTLTGVLTTVSGERVLSVQSVEVLAGASSNLEPIAMATATLGGGRCGCQQAVTEYRRVRTAQGTVRQALPAGGANNIGLLVRITGRVTATGQDHFYIDDGSACDDGSGLIGVKVMCASMAKPAVGTRMVVTGVSSTYFDRGSLWRAVVLPAESYANTLRP